MGLEEKMPPTDERVERNTADEVNERNQRQIEANVACYEGAHPETIAVRIQELEQEWDMERVLEANAAVVALIGLGLGFFVHRRWFLFPVAVAAFLLQHAVQGWCPPVAPWRRAGVRTQSEINDEITALRILRGDFRPSTQAPDALAQVRAT
jgi:hypothetical protein